MKKFSLLILLTLATGCASSIDIDSSVAPWRVDGYSNVVQEFDGKPIKVFCAEADEEAPCDQEVLKEAFDVWAAPFEKPVFELTDDRYEAKIILVWFKTGDANDLPEILPDLLPTFHREFAVAFAERLGLRSATLARTLGDAMGVPRNQVNGSVMFNTGSWEAAPIEAEIKFLKDAGVVND